MFSQEIIDKYSLGSISDCDSELDYYYSFLAKTDHIPNKILEGVATSAEYADELYYREVARRQISGGEVKRAVPLDALLSTLLGVE